MIKEKLTDLNEGLYSSERSFQRKNSRKSKIINLKGKKLRGVLEFITKLEI